VNEDEDEEGLLTMTVMAVDNVRQMTALKEIKVTGIKVTT
jgi:hypothetical protein